MADLKISQLTALATFANDDLLAIVDTSATETKKVEWGAIKTALAGVFWALDGNTVGSEKFIGTIDNFAFPVRTNNLLRATFATSYDLYLGNGITNTSPASFTVHATSGSGSNVAGANLQYAIGQGTGTGLAGDHIFYGAPEGSSGSSLNALFEHFRIKGDDGEIRRANTLYSVKYYGLPVNTSWGANALFSLTTGERHAAFGFQALYSMQGGSDSTAAGDSAGYSNVSGIGGSYYGSDAGYFSTGAGVTFIGAASGTNGGGVTGITTGNYVTALGYGAALKNTSGAIANSTYLGAFTVAEASSEVVIGGLTNNNFYFGVGKFGSAADRTAIIMQPSSVPSGSDYYANETDGNGVNWTFAVSRATGSGTSGDIIWQYAPSGSTGTTLTTLTEAMRLKGTTGSLMLSASLLPATNDGAALGSATLSFSDLFLASGAVVNFANGNSVLTHSSGILTVSTGDLRVTTAGTNAASVATLDGTQTLTNKSIVATQLTGTAYTMAVNNTNATAAYTLTSYRNDAIADFDGTFTWNSTAPLTIVSQKAVWSRIGNMVIMTISVLYTTPGVTNTTCIVTFPSTAPAPAVFANSGDAASEYMYPISGARVEANQTANPSAIRGGIRRNSGDSAFEILVIFGSTSALQLQVTVIYFTA